MLIFQTPCKLSDNTMGNSQQMQNVADEEEGIQTVRES